MRVLLDESLPRPLAKLLTGHEVRTVAELRWTGLKNGALLTRAADSFDVVLTADQNIEFPAEPHEVARGRRRARGQHEPA